MSMMRANCSRDSIACSSSTAVGTVILHTGVCFDHDAARRPMSQTRLPWIVTHVATKVFDRVGVLAMSCVVSCSRRKSSK